MLRSYETKDPMLRPLQFTEAPKLAGVRVLGHIKSTNAIRA